MATRALEALPALDDEDVDDQAATKPRQRKSFAQRRASVSGEAVPLPLGLMALVLQAVTGLLLVRYFLRFFARYLLGCQSSVELRVEHSAITVHRRLDVLGRTVTSGETVIPFANLARAAREVRYPRFAMYAGLVALALGTFVGTSFISDGGWGRSPSLIALGAGIFGVGLALDMFLSSLWPSRRGQYRLLFVPRKGRAFAIKVSDQKAADDALRALAERA
jgi:hypothetical protein